MRSPRHEHYFTPENFSNSNMEDSHGALHLSTLIHNWGEWIRLTYVHARMHTRTDTHSEVFLTRDTAGGSSSHPRTCSSGGRLRLLSEVGVLLQSMLLNLSAVYTLLSVMCEQSENHQWQVICLKALFSSIVHPEVIFMLKSSHDRNLLYLASLYPT